MTKNEVYAFIRGENFTIVGETETRNCNSCCYICGHLINKIWTVPSDQLSSPQNCDFADIFFILFLPLMIQSNRRGGWFFSRLSIIFEKLLSFFYIRRLNLPSKILLFPLYEMFCIKFLAIDNLVKVRDSLLPSPLRNMDGPWLYIYNLYLLIESFKCASIILFTWPTSKTCVALFGKFCFVRSAVFTLKYFLFERFLPEKFQV